MDWVRKVFNKCYEFANPKIGPEPTHVSFTPSTLDMQRMRTMRKIASPVPFQNFMNDIRLNALEKFGKRSMTIMESCKLRNSGSYMWGKLTPEQKVKYYLLAAHANETRVPLGSICEKRTCPDLVTLRCQQLESFTDAMAKSLLAAQMSTCKCKNQSSKKYKKLKVAKNKRPRQKASLTRSLLTAQPICDLSTDFNRIAMRMRRKRSNPDSSSNQLEQLQLEPVQPEQVQPEQVQPEQVQPEQAQPEEAQLEQVQPEQSESEQQESGTAPPAKRKKISHQTDIECQPKNI